LDSSHILLIAKITGEITGERKMPRKKKVEKTVEVEAHEEVGVHPGAAVVVDITEEDLIQSEAVPGVAEQVKEPDIELVDELIRYEFSDNELVDMATEIGEFMHRIDRLTAEKKSAASGYDADIKKMELDMQEMVQFIRDRFSMRREPCHMVKDFKGRKAYYFRADQHTLEWLQDAMADEILFSRIDDLMDGPVKTRDLKSWELQRELEFGKDVPETSGPSEDPDFNGGD
jgi:hypothetical protein